MRILLLIMLLAGGMLRAADPWMGAWEIVWASASQDNYSRLTIESTAEGFQLKRTGQAVLPMRRLDQNTAEGPFGSGNRAGTIRCASNGKELTMVSRSGGGESASVYDRLDGRDGPADPLAGEWIYSEVKTMLRQKTPRIFEATETGALRLRGYGLGFTAAFDGRDHPMPVQSMSKTVALKRVDESTFEAVFRDSADKVIQELRVSVSGDRSRMQFIHSGTYPSGRGHKVFLFRRLPGAPGSGASQSAAAPQLKQVLSDDQIWAHFERWVEALKPLPPGNTGGSQQAYAEALVAESVPREEANRRWQRVLMIRRGSVERERVFWNDAFKLNGGPSAPLRLLREAIRNVKPGRALDAGMGRGRNALFLASAGWDTHGYDMAAGGLEAAQAAAGAAGLKLTTTLAKHDDFEFGKSKWDLIVCAYNYMDVTGKKWPGVFLEALSPGGLVAYQSAHPAQRLDWRAVLDNWREFQLLRLEDQDPGYADDDWSPSKSIRTVMLVARKP